MGRGERAVGPGDRPPARGLRGLGEAADPLDGRADVRLAVPVSPAEPGPGEEYFVLGAVHQAGYDPCPSGEVHLQSGPTPGDAPPGGARGPAPETTPCLEVAPSIYAGSPSSMNSAAAG